ncbi:MAG: twitching motility protein PilT [Candidatus Parcubacteria bacterium]|nr:MAG: twitching motility protein PilT [Candidatus Parcubacteria bacterium]
MDQRLKDYLLFVAQQGGSDLHILPGSFPVMRKDGDLFPMTQFDIISGEESKKMLFSLLNNDTEEKLKTFKDVDFSFSLDEKVRFRVNIYLQANGYAGAFRFIPNEMKSIEELNLPVILNEFIERRQGFILLTGPAGTGKSTTLASLIDTINHQRQDHIITIEEPIEYLFVSDKAVISQREIPTHAPDWHRALKGALRQDPDVLMIGELRDAESISIALTAAETGHLVLATMHTNSAAQTVDRIVDVLPENQKNQGRLQLASTLIGIVSQRLVPRIKGGRIPACEVLIANNAVRNLIRENKIYQIDSVIDTSLSEGMFSLERSLVNLIQMDEITLEKAIEYSLKPSKLKYLLEE